MYTHPFLGAYRFYSDLFLYRFYPGVHTRQLAEVLTAAPGVATYQAVVSYDAEHHDRLVIHVAGDAEQIDAGALAASLRGALKVRAEVKITTLDDIDEGARPLVDERTWDDEA